MDAAADKASTPRWALWGALLASVLIHAAAPHLLSLRPAAAVGPLRATFVVLGLALTVVSGVPSAGAWGALLSLAALGLLAPRLPAAPPASAALARPVVKIG